TTPYLTSNYGGSWTALTVADPPPAHASVPGGTLTVDLDALNADCPGAQVRAWLPDGNLVRLTHQPPIRVCWVAAAKTADGAWWVGGAAADGRPAVAVSHDDGRTWKETSFASPTPGAWAKVIVVGSEVYATVVTGDARSDDTRRGYQPGELTI